MTKKKKVVITLAIIATICILLIGGQTFSKYITEVKGIGRADVAKWDFKVNGTDEQVQTIDLKSTINNTTITENKIAPGTSGAIRINIDATETEVGINYKVQFLNEIQTPTNMVFYYQNEKYDNLTALNDKISGTIFANGGERQIPIEIDWHWPYETGTTPEEIEMNDRIDTEEAKGNTDYLFDVLITGTQVLPNEI